MTATIKKLGFGAGTWLVCVHDGMRGGMPFPSKKTAVAYCRERGIGWEIEAVTPRKRRRGTP